MLTPLCLHALLGFNHILSLSLWFVATILHSVKLPGKMLTPLCLHALLVLVPATTRLTCFPSQSLIVRQAPLGHVPMSQRRQS